MPSLSSDLGRSEREDQVKRPHRNEDLKALRANISKAKNVAFGRTVRCLLGRSEAGIAPEPCSGLFRVSSAFCASHFAFYGDGALSRVGMVTCGSADELAQRRTRCQLR